MTLGLRFAAMLAGAALTAAEAPRTLTEADAGKTIAVRNGESVSLALPATLSAGYGWTLAKSAGVAQQGHAVTSAPSGSGAGRMVGGTQTQTFRLKIGGRGRHVATFQYARPWEHVAPLKTVRFTFLVR